MSSRNEVPFPHNLIDTVTQPPVSIVTPTYNRRKFIPKLIEYIKEQTYPAERIEWIVYDDGTDCIEDILIPHMKSMNIQYIRSEEKKNIGEKRNRLNMEARGKIIVCMDDDDYYPPDRISYAVHSFRLRPDREICGSTTAYMYFTDDCSIWQAGPHNANHATFGTMAYRKSYLTKGHHECNESVVFAEETEFTRHYKEPMIQLDPRKVMLVICHNSNTVDKHKLRVNDNPFLKKTGFKLKDFIKSAKHREFYTSLVRE